MSNTARPKALIALWSTALLFACATDGAHHSEARPLAAAGGANSPAPPPLPAPTPDQLVTPTQSPQNSFARDHKEFYARLVVYDERTDPSPTKCVDSNVLTWIVRAFNKSAASLAFTAQITDPAGDAPITIPLYATSKDGTTNTCSTRALGTSAQGYPITAYYKADAANPFKLLVTLQINNQNAVTVAATTMSVASSVLTFTGAQGNLMKLMGSAPLTSAAATIDASLSSNYSSTNNIAQNLVVAPIPSVRPQTEAGWSAYKDGLAFASPGVQATVWGPALGDGVEPSFLVVPEYTASLLTDAQGNPVPVTEVLGEKLVPPGTTTLRDKLLSGLSGVNTQTSKTVTDPVVLDQFCQGSLSLFETFLTYDDALMAQYANLYENTAFFTSPILRTAPRCLPQDQQDELKNVAPAYTVPSIDRTVADDRTKVVNSRTSAIAHALLNAGDATTISKVISDPKTFFLTIAPDVADQFPATDKGPPSTFSGPDAVSELSKLGIVSFRCGRASPTGAVRTISAVAITRLANQTPLAATMTFANPDPPTGAQTDVSPPVLVALQFYTQAFVQTLQSVDFSSC